MSKEIYISMTRVEASWVLGGLAENYKKVAMTSGGGCDIALGCMESTIGQILQGLYDKKYKIMQKQNPMYRYVKLINFKPMQEL